MDSPTDSSSAIISGSGSNMKAESEWSWAEDKIFEEALVTFPEDLPDRWEKIAECVPGKSTSDVMAHYEILVQDLADIEAGNIEVPDYPESAETRRKEPKRKQVRPWTVDEHMLFLRGLEIYGKGDWKSISRYVITRTPTQVASHGQKFFNRPKPGKRDSGKFSIHDLTTIADCLAFQERSNASASTALHHSAAPASGAPAPAPAPASASASASGSSCASASTPST